MWEKVQQMLSAANTAGDKHKQHYNYLKGSLFCGECGQRMIITMSKNRHGTVYPYFICVGRQKKRSNCKQKAMLIDMVEYLVEQHYAAVQLPVEHADRVREALLEQLSTQHQAADHERELQQKRLHRLAAERQKLLEAFYNDSIPPDLLKAEQARITSEMEHAKRRLSALSAEFDVIRTNLDVAIEFAKHCQQAYLAATPRVRRQLNQAIFEKLYVHEYQEITGDLAEPFRTLLGSEARGVASSRGDGETAKPPTNDVVGGLRVDYLVGAEGLEPPTLSV
jgi:site-specific DNA recombinase